MQGRHLIWFGISCVVLCLYWLREYVPILVTYPDSAVMPLSTTMNTAMNAFTDVFGPLFKAFGSLLGWPIAAAQALLQFLPWSVTTAIFVSLALLASGPRLALFALLACLYMAGIGYWVESMNTLALVLISVPLGVLTGFAFGFAAFYSERARRIVMPSLDLLQTIPAFAYLLPILILFGFGTTVGLVASVLYAFPPMARNTFLGLRSVPHELIEAGLISGATQRQLFWKVRFPASQRQLLLGVNQTTMASLSMVIVASIIGGTSDIGWEVLSTMRKAQFGESVLAGFVIALMAMLLDRISYAFATRDQRHAVSGNGRQMPAITIAVIIFVGLLSVFVAPLQSWPEAWVVYPAERLNAALEALVINGRTWIEVLKNSAFFYVMLPVKIGLNNAISPFTWGFTFTPFLKAVYGLALLVAVALIYRRGRRQLAGLTLLAGTVLFIGLTNMPWLGLWVIIVAGCWQTGGRSLAIGAALGLAFIVVTGIWPQAVLSLYLCGIAVLISFGLGTLIGVWASENNLVSAIVRPIIDTLQTMPLFVLLIPFVMIFKIGEFTALLAVIAYAIVPAIRYTEHGLRNLPEDVIEAATVIGCSRSQLLFRVKLPLALPAIMLGLNQTIIYALGMLVIAALVGTNGLGQLIYIGLGDGDFGVGMSAGIGMAVIAMIADRITQSVSRKRQEMLGLNSDLI